MTRDVNEKKVSAKSLLSVDELLLNTYTLQWAANTEGLYAVKHARFPAAQINAKAMRAIAHIPE